MSEHVAIVGAGVIGAAWASRFVLHGIDVNVSDPHPDAARIVDEVLGNARAAWADLGLPALDDAALVREVHVYGRAQELGARDHDRTQHRGLGTRLMKRAEAIAAAAGYARLSVIASVGTREWYAARGYRLADTYMTRSLSAEE